NRAAANPARRLALRDDPTVSVTDRSRTPGLDSHRILAVMRRVMSIALGVLVVSGWAALAAGCGRDGGQGSDALTRGVTIAQPVSTYRAAPSILDETTPGRPLPDGITQSGCLGDGEMLYAVPAHQCGDGRALVSVIGTPGVLNG